MGLFDSTKTYIESSTQPLYEDAVNGLLDQTVLSAVLQNRNIGNDLVTNIINSTGFKARSMYEYGKLKEDGGDGYYYGLPSGSKGYYTPARDSVVKQSIESEVGHAIELLNCILDIATSEYEARRILSTQGYNQNTGIVTNPPFTPTQYYDVVRFTSHSYSNSTTVRMVYTESDSTDVLPDITRIVNYTVPMVYLGDLYYYATYKDIDSSGRVLPAIKFWQYRENGGTYPPLDVPDADEDPISLYYPVCPIRQNGRDIRIEPEHIRESVRTCLRRIDVDLEEIADAVHDNPDIDDIDHSYIMLGVDIATTSKVGNQYLYHFFDDQHVRDNVLQSDYQYWFEHDTESGPPPVNTVTVKDAATYHITMSWNYSTKTLTNGRIGEVGHVTKSYGITNPISNDDSTYSAETSTLTLRMQISESTYATIYVHGLQHVNYVYSGDTVNTSLHEAFDDPDDKNNFYVPLNINIVTNELGVIAGNDIMYEAIRIVFNTKVVQKLKWYETFWGQLVIIIVAVVITVLIDWSGGTLSAAIAAAGGVSSYVAGIIVTQLVIGFAFKFGVGAIEDLLGEELALAIAVLGTLFTASVSTTGFSATMPTAVSIINASIELLTGLKQLEFKSALEEINEELATLEEEQEEIEELLNMGLDDPLGILGVTKLDYNINAESPQAYYDQAIHSGNAGVKSLDAVSLFVDSQLHLDIPNSPIRNKVY